MPEFREGHFVMQVSSSIPGTSLEQMLELGRRISAEVLALPYVQSIEQQVGRAELGEDTWGPHRSEFHVELKPDAARRSRRGAGASCATFSTTTRACRAKWSPSLGDRISESLSGETAQVAVKVFGDDLDALDATGDADHGRAWQDQGIVDLQFKRQSGTPTIAIRLIPQALAAAGLKVQDVLDTIETAYAGAKVGQTYQGTRTVDVAVLLPDALRHQPAQLAHLMIASRVGSGAAVASGRSEADGGSLQHRARRRTAPRERDLQRRRSGSLQSVVAEAQRSIAQSVALPAGVFLEFTGAAEAERQTRNELLLYSGLALALIVMILFVSFHWRANSWLVLANLPFSLIGSVLAIAVTGIGISLGTVVGLVTVFGVSARNAILQLAHYEHLVEVEGCALEPGSRAARRQRAPGADPDDRRGHGARSRAAGLRHAPPGSGNRRADGRHRARRAGVLDAAQSAGAARPGPALRVQFSRFAAKALIQIRS